MNFFAFGMTDGTAPLDDRSFFDADVVTVEVDGLAVFGVEAHGTPAKTDEVLIAFDEVIRSIADDRPVLPHRFGVVTTTEAIESDLRQNHNVFSDALDRVRDRDEWSIRVRPRVDDVIAGLPEATVAQLREQTAPLERGAAVHTVMVSATERFGQDLVQQLHEAGRPAMAVPHDDGLGADVVALIERSADVSGDIEQLTAATRRAADVELVGPGPAYRFAAVVTGRIMTMEGAHR